MQDEVSRVIDLDPVRADDAHGDGARIGARSDDEVVLEPAPRAVVGEIDAGVYVLVADPGVGGDVRVPGGRVVADEVVGLAGKLLRSAEGQPWAGADKLHAQHRRGGRGGVQKRGMSAPQPRGLARRLAQ